ncbi:MAG: DUF58 domain-containing protein, partial [Phycisphaerales bacterium]|nr:DUF58 domain-containing protein [Phycisphaerales bacterium]
MVALFLAIGAVNSQNNLLFVAFGIAIGGLIVSGIVSGPAMSDVVLRRATLEPATVGEPWHVRYEVTNRSRVLPAFAVVICERPQGATWPRSMPTPTAAIGHIGPRQTVTIDAQVKPFLRGEPTFDRIMAWTTFPFGLLKKSVTFEQHDSAVVRPPVLRVRPDVMRRMGAQGRTVTSAPRRLGSGEEFYGLREYAPGDSPRSIAWRASARAGDLIVRQRAAPSPTRIWILLDLQEADEVEDAIVMAASFAAAAADLGYAVGLVSPHAGLLHLPIEGRRQRELILDDLASIERTDLREDVTTPAGRLD